MNNSKNSTPKLLVGILTYNGDKRIPNILESIKKYTALDRSLWRIVICDDGSLNDRYSEMVMKALEFDDLEPTIVRHPENRGISAGWNSLSRAGSEPIIVLVNDDVLVRPNWLVCIKAFLENNPTAGSVCLSQWFITNEDVKPILEGKQVKRRDPISKAQIGECEDIDDKPGRVMCPSGSCFAFTRDKYELAGGFHPDMQSFYEESYFGTALADNGFPSFVLNYPHVYHLWSATFGENPELKPNERIERSRAIYKRDWGGDFDVTNPRIMSKIPDVVVRWLGMDGEIHEGISKSYEGVSKRIPDSSTPSEEQKGDLDG